MNRDRHGAGLADAAGTGYWRTRLTGLGRPTSFLRSRDGTCETTGRAAEEHVFLSLTGRLVEALHDAAVVVRALGPRHEAPTGKERGSAATPDAAPDHPGRLVAYVVTDDREQIPAEELVAWLRERLPGYMVPSAFVWLEGLPRTPNGKVDRNDLPAPQAGHAGQGTGISAPRTATERSLARIWAEVLALDEVGVDDNFFDLGGHSLSAMRVFAMIRETLQAQLPLAILFTKPTIRELGEALDDPSGSGKTAPLLVPVQPNGSKRPFFCVHAVGGDVICYHALARHLGTDQPFFGIQAKGLDGREEPDTCVEEMAARYIDAMQTVDPHGPYMLGGFSSGGTICYEMARQLISAGKQVRHAAILESIADYADLSVSLSRSRAVAGFLRNLPKWLYDDLLRSSPRSIWHRTLGRLRIRRTRRAKGRHTSNGPAELDIRDLLGVAQLPDSRHRFLQTHYRALLRHRPKPIDVRLTIFRTRTRPLFAQHEHDLGWGRLVPDAKVCVIPGAHEGMLREPHVGVLAQMLGDSLHEATREP